MQTGTEIQENLAAMRETEIYTLRETIDHRVKDINDLQTQLSEADLYLALGPDLDDLDSVETFVKGVKSFVHVMRMTNLIQRESSVWYAMLFDDKVRIAHVLKGGI